MRRRLKNFLPIVLIALAVQIFAPIGVCWAASIAASDPLGVAVICHGNGASSNGQGDQTAPHKSHHGCCSVCSVLHTGAPVDGPQIAVPFTFDRRHARVAWLALTPDLQGARTGSNAQARAPPSIS